MNSKTNLVYASPFRTYCMENPQFVANVKQSEEYQCLRSFLKDKRELATVERMKRHFSHVVEFNDVLTDDCLRFTQVDSVTQEDFEVDTYDISVEREHEYVVNGVVVHNTLKYKPDAVSLPDFRRMMLEHQSDIKCCSVMPQVDMVAFEYQPEEPISKAQYEQISRSIQGTLREEVDKVHIDCAGGACPVDFKEKE